MKIFKSLYYFLYQVFVSNFFVFNFLNFKILIIYKKKFFFFINTIRNDYDLNTLRQIYIKEEYSFNKVILKKIKNLYEQILIKKKIPLIIDCGANIGASSNFFQIIYPNSKIVAIEPDIENLKILYQNIKFDDIQIIDTAISSTNKKFSIFRNNKKDFRSSFIKKKIDSSYKKKTITVGQVLKTYDLKIYKPFLIKIDIEGHEKELFKKNTKWVKLFDVIIIELHDWMLPHKNISLNFFDTIKKYGFSEIYNHGENTITFKK
jgi:FkbM family methyltransferase